MVVLFLKNLRLVTGTRLLSFKRMCRYSLPDSYGLELIAQGYACRLIFTTSLEFSDYINFIYTHKAADVAASGLVGLKRGEI